MRTLHILFKIATFLICSILVYWIADGSFTLDGFFAWVFILTYLGLNVFTFLRVWDLSKLKEHKSDFVDIRTSSLNHSFPSNDLQIDEKSQLDEGLIGKPDFILKRPICLLILAFLSIIGFLGTVNFASNILIVAYRLREIADDEILISWEEVSVILFAVSLLVQIVFCVSFYLFPKVVKTYLDKLD